MKRYILLLSFTLVALAAINFSGQACKNSIARVNVVEIEPATMENSVVCTGKVENTDDGNVYALSSSTVKKIYVKEGDKVKAGQKLMDLKAAATQSLQPTINSYQDAQEAYQSYLNGSASSENDETQSSSPNSGSNDNSSVESLTAPIDGIVTSLATTEEGSYVNSAKPAVVIQSSMGMQVRLSVSESQISEIKVGQKATITGTGFKNSVYSGIVKSIAFDATQVTLVSGTETVIEVIVSVDNVGSDIKPGYTAKAKIVTSKSHNILVAPYETVSADDDGNEYVYCLFGKKAVKTAVTTGEEFDNGFEIKKGLKANDKVILNPDNISNGEHVIPSLSRR